MTFIQHTGLTLIAFWVDYLNITKRVKRPTLSLRNPMQGTLTFISSLDSKLWGACVLLSLDKAPQDGTRPINDWDLSNVTRFKEPRVKYHPTLRQVKEGNVTLEQTLGRKSAIISLIKTWISNLMGRMDVTLECLKKNLNKKRHNYYSFLENV